VGDLANPDGDSLENILEFLLCADPQVAYDRPPFEPKIDSIRSLLGVAPDPSTDYDSAYLELLADTSDPTAHLFIDVDLGDGDWQRFPLVYDAAEGWKSSYLGILIESADLLLRPGGEAFSRFGGAYILSQESLGNDKWRLKVGITTRSGLAVRPFLVRAAALRH